MAHNGDVVRELVRVFDVLSDETRLRIVMALQDGEVNVSELCRKTKTRQPTVSHHLRLMRMARLVNTRRKGKEVFYSLRDFDKSQDSIPLEKIFPGAATVRIGSLVMGFDGG